MTKGEKLCIKRVLARAARNHLRTDADGVARVDRNTGDTPFIEEGRLIETPMPDRIPCGAARALFVLKLQEVEIGKATRDRGRATKE